VAAQPDAAISTRLLMRLIIGLIALWSLIEGIVLVGFQGAASGALGAGIVDDAGQRLVGAHLLVLAPVYLLIAWRLERYESLIWLPFAGQLAVVLSVGYAIVSGETSFGDGILAATLSAIFVGLLAFVWVTEQRSVSRQQLEEEEAISTSNQAAARREQT
jgi:hypothetical protein